MVYGWLSGLFFCRIAANYTSPWKSYSFRCPPCLAVKLHPQWFHLINSINKMSDAVRQIYFSFFMIIIVIKYLLQHNTRKNKILKLHCLPCTKSDRWLQSRKDVIEFPQACVYSSKESLSHLPFTDSWLWQAAKTGFSFWKLYEVACSFYMQIYFAMKSTTS